LIGGLEERRGPRHRRGRPGVPQPVHVLAFAGWGFTAVGMAAVAVALLRTPDDA